MVFKPNNVFLYCRRGSNVSLTLDMSSLGSVEPFVAVPTPREKVAMEYLQSASRILTRSQLRDIVASSHLLQSEFMVSLLCIIHSSIGILIYWALEAGTKMALPSAPAAHGEQLVTVQKVKGRVLGLPCISSAMDRHSD